MDRLTAFYRRRLAQELVKVASTLRHLPRDMHIPEPPQVPQRTLDELGAAAAQLEAMAERLEISAKRAAREGLSARVPRESPEAIEWRKLTNARESAAHLAKLDKRRSKRKRR